MTDVMTRLRQTRPGAALGALRLFLGMLFLSTGVMKLVAPPLRAAFSGQLAEAGIPFHALNMWLVPLAEIGIGVLLLAGLHARLAAAVAIGMMAVATYVHLVVHDPTLFPLQSQAPTIPIVTILLCAWIVVSGAGSWSADLRRG